MTAPFTLFAATVTGVQNNNHYPNRQQVIDAASLTAVAGFDHVAATYMNDRRRNPLQGSRSNRIRSERPQRGP